MTTTSSWASGCLTTTTGFTVTIYPECYITVGKQRRKHSDGIVYLPSETEFEIELFNPLEEDILANIKIDGKYLTGGLIIHPGQRVFLERSWDEPTGKKFRFYTYVVDPSNGDVMRAIESNGNIEVSFHKRKTTSFQVYCPSPSPYTYISPSIPSTYEIYTTGIGKPLTMSGTVCLDRSTAVLETGRVGKGSESSQKFEEVSEEFELHCFHGLTWKLLPETSRPKTVIDLKKYCTECGARIRKESFKYCPHCGNKIE